MSSDPEYGLAPPGSLPTRVAKRQRRRMLARFLQTVEIAPPDSILDVGVTSDRSHSHSNYLEAWYPHKERITAVGVEDAGFLQQAYPGVRFVRADGVRLPFRDASFDVVHSSAVIEHVGSHSRQAAFLRELWRVARKGVFVTTPDRWFPIEVHTVLPLVHYLPPPLFRRILLALGRDFFADETNLNLLSRRSLTAAACEAGIEKFRVESVALLGWPSNLLLIASK